MIRKEAWVENLSSSNEIDKTNPPFEDYHWNNNDVIPLHLVADRASFQAREGGGKWIINLVTRFQLKLYIVGDLAW